MSDSVDREILIVAAEASSCLYAERLLELWKQREFKVRAFGIGNQGMESLGFECLGRAENLAVVGIAEVFKHWSEISGAFERLLAATQTRRPKLALLLDYPDFNLRLAKRLKKMGIQVVYYISPQVWAWRRRRVHLIKRVVDRMLVVFPFEVDFYRQFGVPVDFVGHPLLDEIRPELFKGSEIQRLRERYGVRNDELVLGLMPGSRRSELSHHMMTQIQVAEKLAKEIPGLKVTMLVAPNFSMDEVRASLPKLKLPLILVKDEPFRMIALTDVVLCASGTATLMVGLMRKPMVIMYRMNPVTAWLARVFVRSTAHFGLINLVLGERVVPEFFQGQASSELLAQEVGLLLRSPEKRQTIAVQLAEAQEKLGSRGATERVAAVLESML